MQRPSLDELRNGPAVLTVEEAGAVLGLTKSAAYAAARRGDIPTIRIGLRRLVVPAAKLAELLGADSSEVS